MQNMVDLLAGSLLHGREVRHYANAPIGEGNVLSWHRSKPINFLSLLSYDENKAAHSVQSIAQHYPIVNYRSIDRLTRNYLILDLILTPRTE